MNSEVRDNFGLTDPFKMRQVTALADTPRDSMNNIRTVINKGRRFV